VFGPKPPKPPVAGRIFANKPPLVGFGELPNSPPAAGVAGEFANTLPLVDVFAETPNKPPFVGVFVAAPNKPPLVGVFLAAPNKPLPKGKLAGFSDKFTLFAVLEGLPNKTLPPVPVPVLVPVPPLVPSFKVILGLSVLADTPEVVLEVFLLDRSVCIRSDGF